MKAAVLAVAAVISLLAMVFWIMRKIMEDLRAVPAVKARLMELREAFSGLQASFGDDSQYLRFSRFTALQAELARLRKRVQETRSLSLRGEIRGLLGELEDFAGALPGLRESVNERFFRLEKARARRIFCDDQGNDLLTDEQLKAVLCDDDRNLIIAGAGSGKTKVIDFKVRYLVSHKGVSPAQILLLSFSKKSAGDLVRKISENIPGVEARTIHSFASRAIGRPDRKLFDERHKELEAFVIKALAQALEDQGVFGAFKNFYEKFFSGIKPLIFYKSLDELRADLKKLNSKLDDIPDPFGEVRARRTLKTLKGEYVRSVDERYIADFLYLQDIKYEYERRYPYSNSWYCPDFYLPDYDVYWEHFAITDSGGPPAYFDDPQKYMDGIRWKRNLHREKQTRLMESYSYRLNAGETSLYLTELLATNGIETRSYLGSETAYSKISREFCRVFTKFYHSFKLSGLSLAELQRKYTEQKYLLFLQVFERFLRHFEELAARENKMDFNDLISGATAKYGSGEARSFDYIIVDEFQDTSSLAMRLLDGVYQSNPRATLLSVGDDWQSIYGFNGSDVTILADYAKRYSGVSVRSLNINFRSHARVVELGKRFISKNPAQIPKDVVSRNQRFENAELGFLSFAQMEEKIMAIPDHESVFVLYRYNDDCPAARGMFRDLFVLDKHRRPVRRAGCPKNISLMTIHASKGLEARHVFLLFPDGVRRKFPSEIEDHFVFNMLKTGSDDFPFAEERRLMYVAITRAEQNLYFVSPNKDPNSVFWDELKELVRTA